MTLFVDGHIDYKRIWFLHEQTEYESSDLPVSWLDGHIDYKGIWFFYAQTEYVSSDLPVL